MESISALFEFATEGIIIANRKGIIIRANPSSEKLFGYGSSELVGKVIEDLIPARYEKSHVNKRESYHENPHPRAMGKNMTLFAKRKDSSEFPVEISLTHYTQNDEQYAIAFIIDITDRKLQEDRIVTLNLNLERKVKERTNVLHEALLELEKSKEQLSEALVKEKQLNDMKSRFVTMASHEFRTPLSTILSSVSLIGKYVTTEEDEKRQKHVQRVKSAVINMTLILNDFLSAEKLEEGKIFVRKEEINITNITKEIIAEINGILKPGQKANYAHVGNEIAFLDKQMIRNILLNLISNAIKFSSENKTIIIGTNISDKETIIKVKDEGVGIPKDEQSQLFERFFRAKNVTNIQGTGLGLNIVMKYIEAMKGKIEFTSELNIGTTFIITIPNEK